MRALWSGSLSFGLINIPVKVYSAVTEHTLNLDLLQKGTGKPISYQRVVRGSDKVVPWKDLVRGYQYRKGQYVILEPEDFAKADPHKTSFIEIQRFSPLAQIDSMYYERPYYVEPDQNAGKPYALLREALKKSGMVALATFVLREREHMGVIKADGDVLVLNQLRYSADIRPTKGLDIPGKEELKPRELEMALKLVQQLSGDFAPEEFTDTYNEKLLELIEARAKGKKLKAVRVAEEPAAEDSSDLAAILEQSLRGAARGRAGGSAGKAATKKSAAKPSARSAEKIMTKAGAKSTAKTAARSSSKSASKPTKGAAKTATKPATKPATKNNTKNPAKTAASARPLAHAGSQRFSGNGHARPGAHR